MADRMISQTEEFEILHCAFRYAMGRATYIVGFVADAVIRAWPLMTVNQQHMILREIAEAMQAGRYGMEMDKRQWQRVMDHHTAYMAKHMAEAFRG